jgi:hypothetical protein
MDPGRREWPCAAASDQALLMMPSANYDLFASQIPQNEIKVLSLLIGTEGCNHQRSEWIAAHVSHLVRSVPEELRTIDYRSEMWNGYKDSSTCLFPCS